MAVNEMMQGAESRLKKIQSSTDTIDELFSVDNFFEITDQDINEARQALATLTANFHEYTVFRKLAMSGG